MAEEPAKTQQPQQPAAQAPATAVPPKPPPPADPKAAASPRVVNYDNDNKPVRYDRKPD
jgi:hypothetical protein